MINAISNKVVFKSIIKVSFAYNTPQAANDAPSYVSMQRGVQRGIASFVVIGENSSNLGLLCHLIYYVVL